MNTTILEAMKQYRITAILRGIDREHLEPVVEALYAGGIRLLEITFNQGSATRLEDTAAAIARAKEIYGDRLHVGAGTVMSVEEVAAAHRAGAEFILAPNVDETVIRAAVDRGLCAIPGAMTPTEIAGAYNAGAQIIKLFPAGNLGLGYCKAVMAPLNHIPMIAVGGVDQHNLPSFLKAGFLGAGIGSNLTDRRLIQAGDYQGLKALAEEFVAAAGM
ncbi:MAG: bifunctional 4-hydroxy-2-oxoglutarate aldolase/2-dehydro-3-deoxy-phosphogluconate aldolase [Clostridiales bacterium]|nr:bifunctional 4-hydroxy-2-oxoglutarate aldolase/2-dehydro-3-deoxy-phosphogluconate aldolase [Clostridiales bacterium]